MILCIDRIASCVMGSLGKKTPPKCELISTHTQAPHLRVLGYSFSSGMETLSLIFEYHIGKKS